MQMYLFTHGSLRENIEDIYMSLVVQKGFFTEKTDVAVDISWMYMHALGCQMVEKFSIFDISKWSLQKTVSAQRVKNGISIYHEVTENEVRSP